MEGGKPLARRDFTLIQELLLSEAGISLGLDKDYLVEARLSLLSRAVGQSVSDILAQLQAGDRRLRRLVVESMTTNETSFFRDPPVFDALVSNLVPHLLQQIEHGAVQVWCGATSTGQEPYSLAMALLTAYPDAALRFRILATDLDTQALSRAKEGIYSAMEVSRGLPAAQARRFLEEQDGRFRVSDEVRALVRFRPQNLMHDLHSVGIMNLVLLRNVLIYFDAKTKADVLRRVKAQLGDPGFLLLGSTESVVGHGAPLEPTAFGRCIAYRRAPLKLSEVGDRSKC